MAMPFRTALLLFHPNTCLIACGVAQPHASTTPSATIAESFLMLRMSAS
jgi:hypothetical protein